MAECSESTGRSSPPRLSASRTARPPTTSASLLASATALPASRAASVGPRPARAAGRHQHDVHVAAGGHLLHRLPGVAADLGSQHLGLDAGARPDGRRMELGDLAAQLAGVATGCERHDAKAVGKATDDVERLLADRPGRAEDRQADHRCTPCKSQYSNGPVTSSESSRSRRPPCPGNRPDMSFTSIRRFRADSRKSPAIARERETERDDGDPGPPGGLADRLELTRDVARIEANHQAGGDRRTKQQSADAAFPGLARRDRRPELMSPKEPSYRVRPGIRRERRDERDDHPELPVAPPAALAVRQQAGVEVLVAQQQPVCSEHAEVQDRAEPPRARGCLPWSWPQQQHEQQPGHHEHRRKRPGGDFLERTERRRKQGRERARRYRRGGRGVRDRGADELVRREAEDERDADAEDALGRRHEEGEQR